MARRREMQGICNDLLGSFVSRYNDLGGYWALGFFQIQLQGSVGHELVFDLTGKTGEENQSPFPMQILYYRRALHRHLELRKMPPCWVKAARIVVRANSPAELDCRIEIAGDLGRTFIARKCVPARPHDPLRERCSGRTGGPANRNGK